MSDHPANISIPVDLTNPGQFFACCGLFELADRLWPGAEAWFGGAGLPATFQILTTKSQTDSGASLHPTVGELLAQAGALAFEVEDLKGGADEVDEDDSPSGPIEIHSPIHLFLDWWSDKSIKTWAGSMKERLILKAMLKAIDPANPDPLNDSKPVFDPHALAAPQKRTRRPKKREPFYFDCRRASKAHPLDSGFSPDAHHLESDCFPAVEAMCCIGLQRSRPAPWKDAPNRSTYTAWTVRLPIKAIGPVVCGIVEVPGSFAFTFDNFFRTDQRKHKSYSRAVRERNNDA